MGFSKDKAMAQYVNVWSLIAAITILIELCYPLPKFSLMTSDSISTQDANLENFISLVRSDKQLKDEIKSALNQDQVISIAASRGYEIDSSAILRKWSKHTDFDKDTWMGWFDD